MTIEERIEFLMQSAESHDRQIGELTDGLIKLGGKVDQLTGKVDQLTDAVAALVRVTNEDATDISALARIAQAHETRLSAIEKGPK